MDEEYDKMLKPLNGEEIYICGDLFQRNRDGLKVHLKRAMMLLNL